MYIDFRIQTLKNKLGNCAIYKRVWILYESKWNIHPTWSLDSYRSYVWFFRWNISNCKSPDCLLQAKARLLTSRKFSGSWARCQQWSDVPRTWPLWLPITWWFGQKSLGPCGTWHHHRLWPQSIRFFEVNGTRAPVIHQTALLADLIQQKSAAHHN